MGGDFGDELSLGESAGEGGIFEERVEGEWGDFGGIGGIFLGDVGGEIGEVSGEVCGGDSGIDVTRGGIRGAEGKGGRGEEDGEEEGAKWRRESWWHGWR